MSREGIDALPWAGVSLGTAGIISMPRGICMSMGAYIHLAASLHLGASKSPSYHKLCKKVLLHLMYYSHQEFPEVVPVVGCLLTPQEV